MNGCYLQQKENGSKGWPNAAVIIVLLGILMQLSAPGPVQAAKTDATSLTIAVDHNYPPYSLLAPNGQPAGMLVEMWQLWGEVNQTPVGFLLSGWSETLEAVKTGRAQIHSGLFRNKAREEWLDFSQPLHEIPTAVYMRLGGEPSTDLTRLSGRRVGVIKDAYQQRYLQQRHPSLDLHLYTDDSGLVAAIINDEIDAIVSETPAIEAALNRVGLHGFLLQSQKPLFNNALRAGVIKGETELLSRIDEGWDRIPLEKLISIEQRWITDADNRFYEKKRYQNRLSPDELNWVRQNPIVKLAVTDFIQPFDMFAADGTYTGFNAELIVLLNETLGLQIVPEFFMQWGDVVAAATAGRVDGAFNLSRTPEREQQLLFTDPVAFDPIIVVVRQDNADIANWEDLAGRRVSVIDGAATVGDVQKVLGGGSLVIVENEGAGLRRPAASRQTPAA